jgi:xanthine dehydrogenase accessory factor
MSTPHGYIEKMAELANGGQPFVAVTMVEAVGSTPQDVGSKMLVTREGLAFGTVGGGRIEHQAIGHAQKMLAGDVASRARTDLVKWNLQKDVGMTCGGVVTLYFEAINHGIWRVVIFGAGHVARAVIGCLDMLDCRIICIDPRQEWLDRIPDSPKLEKLRTDDMPGQVQRLKDDDYVLCMTMGHKTDRPVLAEIFREDRKVAYLGVIGSQAKRAVLIRELREAGVPADRVEGFLCPIGLDIGTNQPGEIAISVVAQLIQHRDQKRITAPVPTK